MNRNPSADHQRAAAYFDRSGEIFDSLYSTENVSSWQHFLNQHFRRDIYERYRLTMNHLRESSASSVLDIGIGGARYAQGYIDAAVKRVLGLDISSTMLDLARQHVAQISGGGTTFEFVQSDINEYDTSETFDVVVAMGFFDYTPDPAACLRKFHRLSKHSCIASFPSRSWYRTPIRKFRYLLKNCPVYFYDERRLQTLATEAGFARCEIVKIKGSGMDYVARFYK